MDPAIANQDFDPPPPPPVGWRGLAAALAVNALFIVGLLWSVPWYRASTPEVAARQPATLATMGGPPAVPAPAPAPDPAAATSWPYSPTIAAPAGQAAPPRQSGASQPAAPVRTTPARPATVAAQAAAPPTTSATGPSFDCGKELSTTERLICADAELSRLDRELGRLTATALSLSTDPVAFRRTSDREWKRREAECRDKACLLAWYAQRREHMQVLVDAGTARARGG